MSINLDAINDAIGAADEITTDHPAATPEQNALLAWAAAHPIDRPSVPVDGRGQYRTVHPVDGGKAKGYTRASTFAGALDDAGGLTVWRNGILMRGIGMTPNLAEAATAAHEADDLKTLRSLAGTALHVGGEKLAADIGTALHLACEHADDVKPDADPFADFPDAYRPDVRAYRDAMAAHRLTSTHIEPTAFISELGVVGRIDRLVSGPWGPSLRVVDLKTGSSPERIAYAVQMAAYAHATHLWDGEAWQPAPEIDTTTAYIAHAPAGKGECSIVEVDVAAGWELAQLAKQVRAVRSAPAVRALFAPATVPPAAPVTSRLGEHVADDAVPFPATKPADRSEWVTGRITTLVASTAAKTLMRDAWPTGCPKVAPWTDEQIDTIAPILDEIEATVAAPFPHLDPTAPTPDEVLATAAAERVATIEATIAANQQAPEWPTPDNGAAVDHDEMAPLFARVAELPAERKEQASAWAAEGKRQGRSWGKTVDLKWSERTFSINLAALRCIAHLWDDDEPDALTRAALALVTGDDLQPSWLTGAVLGSLTIDEAQRLDDIAAAFGAGDAQTVADIGGVLARVA